MSLGEMYEGVRDTKQVREGSGKEVGSVGVKLQSGLGRG